MPGGGGVGIGFSFQSPRRGGSPGRDGAKGPGGCLQRIGEFWGGAKYFFFGAEMSTKIFDLFLTYFPSFQKTSFDQFSPTLIFSGFGESRRTAASQRLFCDWDFWDAKVFALELLKLLSWKHKLHLLSSSAKLEPQGSQAQAPARSSKVEEASVLALPLWTKLSQASPRVEY